MSLNPAQKVAAEFLNGTACIIAVPGSGKTHTMTARVVNLVEKGVRPENILGLTFTKKASYSMKTRVKRALKNTGDLILLTTIHSFAFQLLKSEEKKFELIMGKDELKFLRKIIKQLKINNVSVGNAIKEISFLKNTLVTPQILIEENEGNDFKKNLALIYETYDHEKRLVNRLDFNDLLVEAAKLLEDVSIRKNYQERYRHILVDEFQDTTPLQMKLIKFLAQKTEEDNKEEEKKNRSLWVCGDDWQSIYSFTGATVDNILNFHIDFPERELFFLNLNYRSTPQVLQVCQNLIGHNLKKIDKKLDTLNKEGEWVDIIPVKDEEEEAKTIVNTIKELVQSGDYEYKDIGILFRANSQSRLIEETLIMADIPYISDVSINFYGRNEVKNLINYLFIISDPYSSRSDKAVEEIINIPNRFIGREFINTLNDYAKEKGFTLYQALRQMPVNNHGIKISIQEFISLIEMLINERNKLDTASIIKRLRIGLNYDNYISEDEVTTADESRVGNVNQLEWAATKYPVLETFLMYVEKFLGNTGKAEDGVKIMTVHKSKGLEFPVVFVPGLSDGMMPHKNGEIEEERRIAFVAISRAMYRLYITFPYQYMGKPVKKSVFLYELFAPLDIDTKIYTNESLFI